MRSRGGDHGLRRNAEARAEAVQGAQRQCVHAPVVGRDERERIRGRSEPVERLRVHKRAIRHDDESAVRGARVGERQVDGVGMAGAAVDEHVQIVPETARVWRHE